MYQKERVQLRPLERKHLQKCVEWLNDPEVTEHLSMSEPMSMEGEQRWYENLLRDKSSRVYAIETLEGNHIGNVGFHNLDLHDRKAELGIFVGEKKLWGKGYGTEAILLALKLAFEGLNLNRVYLRTFSENKRAQKCYEKVGFKKEGVLREDSFKSGKYVDSFIYSVLAREYLKDKT
ncbi:MAG: GNAT family N-acetyltransferase [Theionarchaea archaeon]|nr:GNAT family N-acetyltransferase [Theionarchaea archaeon]